MTQDARRFAAIVAAVAVATVCSALMTGVGVAVAGAQARTTVRADSGGTWDTAQEVPGTAALNTGGFAVTRSVSCASVGDCSAGGFYTETSGNHQAFVVGEANGTWGTATEIASGVNTGGFAVTESVSCNLAGTCGAGGFYTDGSGHQQAFVVGETNGTWSTVREVPGSAKLNQGGSAQITSVSCTSAGNCSAGGSYRDSSSHSQAFVVGETNGTWGTAQEIAAGLNQGGDALTTSVSCASAGNCSAGGLYRDGLAHFQAFVVGETNGTWGTVQEVPGTAALNRGGSAQITSVSCAAMGNCSAGGNYLDGFNHFQAFVVNEKNGTWSIAKRVAAALNQGGHALINSVSCASAGNCGAGGFYTDGSGHSQAFVVGEITGTWGIAKRVAAALNQGGHALINSVSCASAGNCSAGGLYTDGAGRFQAFVVGETSGTWGTAEELPGTAALNQGVRAAVAWVSCAAAGHCSAGGFYTDRAGHQQAYVDSET